MGLIGTSACYADRSGLDGVPNPAPRGSCTPLCENGGVCVGSECICGPVDFKGPTCAEWIDDCLGVDCLNGNCLDRVRAWSCNCHPGWAIDDDGLCSVELLSCDTPNACVYGSCDDSSGAVICSCDPGFQGTNCNVPINCGSPPAAPAHAVTSNITGTELGDVVVFACNLGFGEGSTSVSCKADGNWESPMLECDPAECGAPEPIRNGTVVAPDGTTYGALATYSCEPAFQLEGSATRNCGADGTWDGETPQCVLRGNCSADPCVHGVCFELGHDTFECGCDGGWTGALCDTDVDECDGGFGPCNPGGTSECVNQPGSYVCNCSGDWEGKHCQDPD